ncbi:MAG: nucleotidyl transferase AbiEii/AbiGii toxin family protein [Actinomycetota bacterium]|nr:nucleotidyl transferase AbiEii/AbiGii toxin family protein [Actinomycetota bacterium]
MPFAVKSEWFTGNAEVHTFAVAELFATKIRALYQRRKGRDLFDMWLGLTELQMPGSQIVGAFGPYRPAGLTATLAEENLREKLNNAQFRSDLDALVSVWPPAFDIDDAAELVIAEVLRLL